MRILVLCKKRKYIDENGNYRHRKQGYKGSWSIELWREELQRQADSFWYGWGYGEKYGYEWDVMMPLPEVIEKYYPNPDVILVIGYEYYPNFNDIKNILKVNIAGDYNKGLKIAGCVKHYNLHKYDISFGYSTVIRDHLKETNVGKYQYILPFGVNTSIYKKDENAIKDIDVSAFYGKNINVYPLRQKIQKMILKMDIVSWTQKAFFYNGINVINRSKISIDCNTKYKFVNPRTAAILACGTFLLSDWRDDLEKFGFVDGQHLVSFDSLEDLKDKIYYYLEHEDEREEIALNGMNFVRENYNDTVVTKNFLDTIEKHL